KGKVTPLSRTTKPRKDPAAVNMFAAAAKGSLPKLEKTLKDNDLGVLNPSSETLLHVAAARGHLSIMKYLLSKGARTGKNLHSIIAALIDRGTDISAHNKMHYTPLLLACEMGKAESAEVLMEKGANLGIRTPADTALHLANNGALIGLLVNAGARINAVTKDFVTPLHMASLRGHTEVAQQLLHHKAQVNAQDKQFPLHLAAEQGHKTLAEILLKARADPNTQDKEKKAPLRAAALREHLKTLSESTESSLGLFPI
uniref:Uncharacterized protein n=1 Tax=Ficedula albicollis TaxID=59894 RepID=A0A803W403_FICAL